VPGVLGEASSTEEESFEGGLLEYPQYTRPAEFRGRAVPEVLQGGNHALIRAWRRARALEHTAARRPDLFAAAAPLRAELAARTHVALVHHPVLDRNHAVVTTSVTNLDLHDIARAAATFGLAGYHVVTPVTLQREKVQRILGSWPHEEQAPDFRDQALARVRLAAGIDEAIAAVAAASRGARPLVVATSARPRPGAASPEALLAEAAAAAPRPLLVLLGTGWGLTDEVISSCDRILAPIHGPSKFNHLSVRSAAAILLDRLFGDRDGRAA
jgi:tRNA (guanine37-N1)-methyltransferase